MSISKQLCVNRLPLPCELLDILKSYAFDDIVVYSARIRKKYITHDIKTTPFTYKDGPYYNLFGFWIDDICPQFQMEFCTTCGNYVKPSHEYKIFICDCR